MHGATCVVFMSLRIAKVHNQPIPLILRDIPIKGAYDLGTEHVVVRRDLEQLFGIEALGTLRNTH
jgi:hypothetical protein